MRNKNLKSPLEILTLEVHPVDVEIPQEEVGQMVGQKDSKHNSLGVVLGGQYQPTLR
jgi:hypothetical protein